MSKKLMTIDEVAEYLGISSADVQELLKSAQLSAYKIGGTLIRFERDQIVSYKKQWYRQDESAPIEFKAPKTLEASKFSDKVIDFFLFNDFYIVCVIVVLSLVFFVL